MKTLFYKCQVYEPFHHNGSYISIEDFNLKSVYFLLGYLLLVSYVCYLRNFYIYWFLVYFYTNDVQINPFMFKILLYGTMRMENLIVSKSKKIMIHTVSWIFFPLNYEICKSFQLLRILGNLVLKIRIESLLMESF